jgi:ketosteroid isomerase-like protein
MPLNCHLEKTLDLMRVIFSGVIFLFFWASQVCAQSPDDAVKAVINNVFTAIHKGDTVLLKSAFANDVTMATVVKNKEGNVVMRRESLKSFVTAVGKPQPEPLTEEIWDVKVQRDGDFAQAWCDYAFYIGKRFSHCGVDAFQLYKTADGWKIFHLADTRRKENCNVPDEIQKKYN